MKTRFLKTVALAIFSILGLGALTASPSFAATSCDQCKPGGTIPADVCSSMGCDWPDSGSTQSLESSVAGILNGIIYAMGIVAVIFIIIGGINYMTSAGDASKVEKGKKTILYALIGLVICALAFAIVNWVIIGIINK